MTKKISCLLLCTVLLLSFTACGSNLDSVSDENTKNDENSAIDDNNTEEIVQSVDEGLLFTTEYTVEDYVENGIIVSKNDGLLYGLLDNNGNEIIPVKYDDLVFMNKYDYVEGKCENLYLSAQYEDVYTVFDINGNKVMGESNEYINCVNSEIKSERDDSFPFFYTEADDEIIFYNEEGYEYSRSSKVPDWLGQIDYVSDKWYIIYQKVDNGITIYDYEGIVMEELDEYLYSSYIINDEYYMLVSSQAFSKINGKYVVGMEDGEYVYATPGDYHCEKIKIDKNGNVSIEETYYDLDDLIAEEQVLMQQEKTAKKYYNLYESNSTWKLEDLDGNTLYDERYYDAFENHSENDCLALLNEDNQVLLISRTGKIYCNYGILETNDGGDTVRMLCGDSSKTINEIFEGRNSILIPVSSSISGSYDLYYFKEK